MTGERLLPCPWPYCLSADVTIQRLSQWAWAVQCWQCHAHGPTGDTAADAAERWNRRPIATERDAVLEEAARLADTEARQHLASDPASWALEDLAGKLRALKTSNHRPKGGDGVG